MLQGGDKSVKTYFFKWTHNYKEEIEEVDILFHPHHGRKTSAIPCDLLTALNPKIIVIGNALAKDIDYKNSSRTITRNSSGDILFENEPGRVHIFTKNKIDNDPTCLKRNLNDKERIQKRRNILDWYYAGTLTI